MERSDSTSGVSRKPEKYPSDSGSKSLEQMNAELSEQNLRLRAQTERRSAAMAHLAHELRTPLTSILGFSEILLSQETLTDAQRNFCERIQNSARQLQDRLTQLADLARMETESGDDTSTGRTAQE